MQIHTKESQRPMISLQPFAVFFVMILQGTFENAYLHLLSSLTETEFRLVKLA